MTSRTVSHGALALVVVALLLAAALALSGCSLSGGGTTTTAAPTTTTAAPTTTTEAETTTTAAIELKFGGKGTWQGISVTVESAQLDTTPVLVGAGNKVVYCMVTIMNGSKGAFDYNGHQEYDNAGMSSVADIGEGTLAPGETAQGAVAFEIPMNAQVAGMKWQPSTSDAPVLIWGTP